MYGTMTTEHTVWCATCVEWYQTPSESKKTAADDVKNEGWRKDKKLGWICPKCQKRLYEVRPKNM